MTYELIQIIYWLALSLWFGGALFIAIASRVIQKTLQEANPIMPDVLSVNLEGQHGTLLAGSIVGNILTSFGTIEYVCAGLTAAALAYFTHVDWDDSAIRNVNLLRLALLGASIATIYYDRQIIWPLIWQSRQKFIDHADEPETANPAKDRFDRYQSHSLMALQVLLFLLLGLVLFSGSIQRTIVGAPVPSSTPSQHDS